MSFPDAAHAEPTGPRRSRSFTYDETRGELAVAVAAVERRLCRDPLPALETMNHPALTPNPGQRRRLMTAALRGTGGDCDQAALRVRRLTANALRAAAEAIEDRSRNDRVRALIDRAIRRASLVADLER